MHAVSLEMATKFKIKDVLNEIGTDPYYDQPNDIDLFIQNCPDSVTTVDGEKY